MQLAGRLHSAWSLIRDRLRHRNLLILLLLHITSSAILFILSILSVESNVEASHLLRHIIQTANLSSVVFYNPEKRKTGDWEYAPALIAMGNETISKQKEDGILCSDDGKKCRAVGKALQKEPYSSDLVNSSSAGSSSQPNTETVSTTLNTQGRFITTKVFLVPTLTVIQGEAITTQVVLNEQGSIMEAQAITTLPSTTSSSSRLSFSTISSSQLVTTSTRTSTTISSATSPTAALENSEGEEKDDDDDESVDGSDDSDDESEDAPRILRVSKNEYIQKWKRDIRLVPNEVNGQVVGVDIAHLGGSEKVESVSLHCAVHYGWAVNSLDNLVREESVLAAFFIWILGLAIVGLLNESIPHFIWTAIDLRISVKFWNNFQSTTKTHCAGVNVLPMYLGKRIGFQSSVLGLTLITLVASSILCWKIRDHFGWQTFQRIGASSQINRIYKLVLAISILLQLDAFVLVTFFALFLDQIWKGPASYFMWNCKAFKAIYSLLIVVLLPWLYLGWTSMRKEQRKRFNLFVGLSICIIGGWAVSFANNIFRITFITWTFFTAMGSLALALTVITLVLAIIRRITFGKGLADFLYLEEIEERAGVGFDEKPSVAVAMPRTALPTFSTAFGPGPAPPPRQMFPPMPVYLTATRVSSAPSWRAGDDSRLQ